MLTFIRKIKCRVAFLGLVLVSFEVIYDSVWVRFGSFRWNSGILPGARPLVFPSFDQVVTTVPDYFTASQSSLISPVSCYFVALAVNTDHFISLFRPRKALETTVPEATMVLKDGFGFWMVALNSLPHNGSFIPMATSVKVDVNATLPCLIL